jgi:hypothetical protein
VQIEKGVHRLPVRRTPYGGTQNYTLLNPATDNFSKALF